MFDQKDFSKLNFKIHETDDVDSVKRLENCSGLDLIVGRNREKIIRYLVYMYDYGSPFQTIRDVAQRKKAAAVKAEFDFSKDEKLLRKLFELEDPYSVAVAGLLREQNNALFTSIVVEEQLFFAKVERLIRPMKDGMDDKDEIEALIKQQKLSEAMNNHRISIQKLYKEMSGGDELLEAALPVAVQITKVEYIARMIKYRN